MLALRTVFLCSLTLLGALPAAAMSLCDKDDPSAEHKSPADLELDEAPALTEQILPCSMVENGQLGAWCADATVYVVTQSGTVLCRVLLPEVDLSTANSSELNERPSAPTPERPQNQAPQVLVANAPPVPATPSASAGDPALDAACDAPRPVYAEPPFAPG